MQRFRSVLLLLAAAIPLLAQTKGIAHIPLPADLTGTLGGTQYRVRVPINWNGTLLVYAHGAGQNFVQVAPPTYPLGSLDDQLLARGYALAGSYFIEFPDMGVRDTLALTNSFNDMVGIPTRNILWGESLGGFGVLALMESHDSPFDGAIAIAPVAAGYVRAADLMLQYDVAYAAAFGWPTSQWGPLEDLRDDLFANPSMLIQPYFQFLSGTGSSRWEFIRLIMKASSAAWNTGNPFDGPAYAVNGWAGIALRSLMEQRYGGTVCTNIGVKYTLTAEEKATLAAQGLIADDLLAYMNNRANITANSTARNQLVQSGSLNGNLRKPVLTMHNVLDEVVPVSHETVYRDLVNSAGASSKLVQAYINDPNVPGHTAFTVDQILTTLKAMEHWLDVGTRPDPSFFPATLKFDTSFVPPPWPFTLGPSSQPPVIALSVTNLAFNLPVGSTPSTPQQVQLTNSGGQALVWTAVSSAAWLTASPSSGTAPSTLNIVAAPGNLTPGSYKGTITISATGAAAQTIAVALSVTQVLKPSLAANPQQMSFTYQIGAATPSLQTLSVTSSGTALPLTISSSGGTWLSVSPASATTPASFAVQATPEGLAPGTYNGQITITSAGASNSPLNVPASLAVTASSTALRIAGVVNGASFAAGFASSTWVTITGSNLAPTTRIWRGDEIVNGQLPTSLDGVSVTINGNLADVYFISPGQLNVLAPTDTSTGTADQMVPVTVTAPSGTATMQALKRYIAPGMFMLDTRYVAAVNMDGSLVVPEGLFAGAASHPAKPGDYVSLYTTGLGPTDPPVPASQIPSSVVPLANPVNVTIAGANANVLFAGLVSPGLYQVNLQVPDVPDGDQPISIQVLSGTGQGSAVISVRR